jgi:hypothetical protein
LSSSTENEKYSLDHPKKFGVISMGYLNLDKSKESLTQLLYFFFLSLSILSCTKNAVCNQSDKGCLQKELNQHSVKKIDHWKSYSLVPLEDRIVAAPPEIVDFVKLDNQKNEISNSPSTAVLSEEFLQDVRLAVSELPKAVKNLLNDKLVGIFLVDDLGGTGFSDSVYNKKGEPIAGFILLDASILKNKKANEWASWKEQTPFQKDQHFEIEALIENKENNNRKSAIQYILLHEFGHVVSIGEYFHAAWNIEPNDLADTEAYKFFNQSWVTNRAQNRYDSKFDKLFFSDRTSAVYYFGAKLKGNQMIDVYNKVEKTDFVTLYATTNPSDDWAESFVTYVHSVLMKKPFQISIKEDGQVKKYFKLCWGTSRCAKKESIISKLFQDH